MAKPATAVRNDAIAKGYPIVHKRFDNGLDMKNEAGKHYAVYQVGGGWHYNGDQETDTAWEQDAVAEYLKMVKAGYNLRARKLFNAGDLIQWTDPVSGQYVKFQPQNFQWIDGTTGSNSLISVAQAVASPSIDDDKLYWPAAFGAGRHFRYTAAPTKLIKHLIIDSAANLPACPTWITNPWLELTFTLTPSSGVIMYVDGLAWNQSTSKTTANAIEFRLPSGEVVWSMAAPLAYDSSEMGEPCNGQIKLYVNKKIKYCAVRFPKSWIDTATFPIMLDPTLDYQVGAGSNDGVFLLSSFYSNGTTYRLGQYSTYTRIFLLFSGVTIPDGATIDTSYLSFYEEVYGNYGVGTATIYANDENNPSVVSSYEDGDGRALTTANATVTSPNNGSGVWFNSNSINNIISEMIASYSFVSGANLQFIIADAVGTNAYSSVRSYDYAGNAHGAKLHIEYTEAAAVKPAANVIWIG